MGRGGNRKGHMGVFGLAPVFLIVAWIGVFPIAGAAIGSFFSEVHGVREFVGWKHFRFILSDRGFLLSLNITLLFSTLATGCCVLLSFCLALCLCFSRWLSRLVYLSLLIPWAIPAYILVPSWRAILHGPEGISLLSQLTGVSLDLMADPIAAFLSCLLLATWISLPLTSFVFWTGIQKIPRNLRESFRVEGASRSVIARHLFWPMLLPSIKWMAILAFIRSFKEFSVVFLLTAGGPPLVQGITSRSIIGATTTLEMFVFEQFSTHADLGLGAAYSLLMAGVVLVVIFLAIGRKKGGGGAFFLVSLLVHLVVRGLLWPLRVFGYAFALLWGRKTQGNRVATSVWLLVFLLDVGLLGVSLWKEGLLRGMHPATFVAAGGVLCLLVSRPTRKRLAGGRWAGNGVWLFSVLVAFSCLLAALLSVFFLVRMSVSHVSSPVFLSLSPASTTFRWFQAAFSEENLLRHVANSLRLALPVMFLAPLLCFPAAYALSRLPGKISARLLMLLTLTGFFGGVHTLVPLFVMFRAFPLGKEMLPLILIYLFQSIPFCLFSLKAFFERFPRSLEEMARLEGVGRIPFFVRVVFPLSLPAMVPPAMFSFLLAWNGFLAPLVFLRHESQFPVSIKIHSLVGSIASGNPEWNLFAAISVMNVVVVLGLFVFFRGGLENSPLSDFESE